MLSREYSTGPPRSANRQSPLPCGLELHFLPGYAPELNPVEFVWNDMRMRGTSKRPLRRNESLKARVLKDLADIKADRNRVRSYFRAESVAYVMN